MMHIITIFVILCIFQHFLNCAGFNSLPVCTFKQIGTLNLLKTSDFKKTMSILLVLTLAVGFLQ